MIKCYNLSKRYWYWLCPSHCLRLQTWTIKQPWNLGIINALCVEALIFFISSAFRHGLRSSSQLCLLIATQKFKFFSDFELDKYRILKYFLKSRGLWHTQVLGYSSPVICGIGLPRQWEILHRPNFTQKFKERYALLFRSEKWRWRIGKKNLLKLKHFTNKERIY